MKALIIEDREGMKTMLMDVLEKNGIEHTAVNTVEEAMATIQADKDHRIVILDTAVSDGTGMSFIDDLESWEAEPESKKGRRQRAENGPAIIVIRNSTESVPESCIFVKAELVKPFTTSMLVDAINAALPKDKRIVDADRGRMMANPNDELVRRGITYGESYVFFQENPRTVLDIMQTFSMAGYDMLLITASRAKVARERFGLDKGAEVYTLKGNFYPLGTMIDMVRGFIEGSRYPVVALDDLDNIIDHCGIDRTFVALKEILALRGEKHKFTFLASVDGEVLKKNERAVLTSMMTLYKEE